MSTLVPTWEIIFDWGGYLLSEKTCENPEEQQRIIEEIIAFSSDVLELTKKGKLKLTKPLQLGVYTAAVTYKKPGDKPNTVHAVFLMKEGTLKDILCSPGGLNSGSSIEESVLGDFDPNSLSKETPYGNPRILARLDLILGMIMEGIEIPKELYNMR